MPRSVYDRNPDGEVVYTADDVAGNEVVIGRAVIDALATHGYRVVETRACPKCGGAGSYSPTYFSIECEVCGGTGEVTASEEERDRYRAALEEIAALTSGPHKTIGEACGVDFCNACLIHGTASAALSRNQPTTEDR